MSRADLKDDVFLRMALELSRLGTCCRLKVGCVLLRPDGGIASGGYNGALPQWPDPQDCAVLLNDQERHLEAVLLPSGALVRPHQPSERWRSVEMHEDLSFCATTWSGYRECYAPDGTQLTRVLTK